MLGCEGPRTLPASGDAADLPGFRDVINGQMGEHVMPGVAAPEGQRTTQDIGRSLAKPVAASRPSGSSSRSTILGVGIVGVVLTALAVGSVIMATGPAPTPVASAAAPVAAVAPASVVAPVTVFAPVAAPATAGDIAQALARLGPAPTPQPRASDQCEIAQPQRLAVEISASTPDEVGNVVRFSVGSYVSPPIVVTRIPQVVAFPAPPGSRGTAQMMTEQRNSRGFTLDGTNGLATEFGATSKDLLHSVVNLHWTPRC